VHEPLPPLPEPQGRYVPAVTQSGLVVSAGMTPRVAGELIVRGLVGRDVDIAEARAAAGTAARNALSAIAGAAGGLEEIQRCLRMSVFVACVDGFEELSTVADGATAGIVEHLGPDRLPARSAIGVRALPSCSPIEVELMAVTRAT
jgi:enamine deaminase RidA (YjgF/YER057c/UK114 family)